MRIHAAGSLGRAGEHAALKPRQCAFLHARKRHPALSDEATLLAASFHASAYPFNAKGPEMDFHFGSFHEGLGLCKLPIPLLQTFERGAHGVDDLVIRHYDGLITGEQHRILVHHLHVVA